MLKNNSNNSIRRIMGYKTIFIFLFVSTCFLVNVKYAQAVPVTPTNLTATTAGLNTSPAGYQINLAWQYGEPENIDGYNVYVHNDIAGDSIIPVASGGINGDYYIELSATGLIGPEEPYTFYVTAISGGEESADSDTVQAYTSDFPDAPTDLQVAWPVENSSRPEFSWTYTDLNNNFMEAYRIIVYVQEDPGADYPLLSKEMWDSGKINKNAASGDTVTAYYNDANGSGNDNNSFGHPLDWGGFLGTNDYYFRVQVWDEYGLDSELSSSGPAFKPEINGVVELFDDTDFLDEGNTTADWNVVYSEARLKSFATVDSYKNLVIEGESVKAAAYWNGFLSQYHLVYLKKISGSYGLYYSAFDNNGNHLLTTTLDVDLGTADPTFLMTNITCDSANNLCGVVYTKQGINLDAYFLEVDISGAVTIPAIALDADLLEPDPYPNEKNPVIIYGNSGAEHKYLISWFEEDAGTDPFRKAFYALVTRGHPTINATLLDTSQSNIFPSVAFNTLNTQFGIVWSRYWEPYNGTNSELFFNIIAWNGAKLITTGIPEGKPLTVYSPNYSNYPFIKWEPGNGEYYIVWKDARDYEYMNPPPENQGVIDLYFMKLNASGGRETSDIKLVTFPSRRKYFISESAVAINCFGRFGLSWLDDRALGNLDNSSFYNKTFNNYSMEFSISPGVGATEALRTITPRLFSTSTLPYPAIFGVDESVDSMRSILLYPDTACTLYYSVIFDQGGDIFLQYMPNQNNQLFNTDDKIIQSDIVMENEDGLGSVTLYASDATDPPTTSVNYYIASNDGPVFSWVPVTHGDPIILNNTELRWKAVLNGVPDKSPLIGSLAFEVNSVPPSQPSDLKVDGWGWGSASPDPDTATTTEDFTPELSWIYSDPLDLDMGAYRIQVCTQPFSNNTVDLDRCPKNELMWDSGKITKGTTSGDRVEVSYNDADGTGDDKDSHGHPLDWNTDYYWQVRTWNTSDLPSSSWSDADLGVEISAEFKYGDDVNIDDLIVADDFKLLPVPPLFVLSSDNPPEFYEGAQGEIRLTAEWPPIIPGSYSGEEVDPLIPNRGLHTGLALDSKNNPHICYYKNDGTPYNISPWGGQLKYAYYNGSSWNIEDVNIMGGGGFNCSIVIDHDDKPHISYWSNYDNTTPEYADIMYAYKGSASWEVTPVEADVNNGAIYAENSMVVDSKNKPTICYNYKISSPYTLKMRCARYDSPTSPWDIYEFTDNGTGYANNLTIDKDDNLHLAYSGARKILYRKYTTNTGSWSTPTEVYYHSLYNANPTNMSIAVDSNNNPGISFTINTATGTGNPCDLMYSEKNGDDWVNETANSLLNCQGGTSLNYNSLDNPKPRVVFNGSSDWDLFYIEKIDDTWGGVVTIESEGNTGRFPYIGLSNDDIPHISYGSYQGGNPSTILKDLLYIRPFYDNINEGSIKSANINLSAEILYGLRFHASYANPLNESDNITFYIKTNNPAADWIDVESQEGAGCIDSDDGCIINLSNVGGLNLIGNELYWKFELETGNENYAPRIGSIAIEKYNIPPRITYCEYNPTAIDPGQEVTIDITVINELYEDLEYSWCFDLDDGAGACGPPGGSDWSVWANSGDYTDPALWTYDIAGIYNPEVQVREELPPDEGQESEVFICPNLFVGDVQIAWLEAKYSNIYTQGDIHSYGVPCEACGPVTNATYKLEAGGRILGFDSACYDQCIDTAIFPEVWGLSDDDCLNECTKEYSGNIINFPKASLNFRNALGDLTADPQIKGLLTDGDNCSLYNSGQYIIMCIDVSSPIYPFGDPADIADTPWFWTSGTYDDAIYSPVSDILYITDLTVAPPDRIFQLNGPNQTNTLVGRGEGDVKGFRNGEFEHSNGDGTIIVDGDLHIYSGFFDLISTTPVATSTPSIIYDNTPIIQSIKNLASIAWIIKGDLIIEYDVEELAGNFIVLGADSVPECQHVPDSFQVTAHCGAIYTAGKPVPDPINHNPLKGDEWIPVLERKPLVIKGMVIAKRFMLNRHYLTYLGSDYAAAESIINDGRALLNPPPGLEDLVSGLPNWQTNIAP